MQKLHGVHAATIPQVPLGLASLAPPQKPPHFSLFSRERKCLFCPGGSDKFPPPPPRLLCTPLEGITSPSPQQSRARRELLLAPFCR